MARYPSPTQGAPAGHPHPHPLGPAGKDGTRASVLGPGGCPHWALEPSGGRTSPNCPSRHGGTQGPPPHGPSGSPVATLRARVRGAAGIQTGATTRPAGRATHAYCRRREPGAGAAPLPTVRPPTRGRWSPREPQRRLGRARGEEGSALRPLEGRDGDGGVGGDEEWRTLCKVLFVSLTAGVGGGVRAGLPPGPLGRVMRTRCRRWSRATSQVSSAGTH